MRNKLHKRKSVIAAIGIVAIAAGLTIASFGAAGGIPPSGQPVGLSGSVSALDRTAPLPTPVSAQVTSWIEGNARRLGGSPASLRAGTRLLRAHLGRGNRDVYAYRSSGLVCFLLTGEGGTCGDPGFVWTLGGGDGITDAGGLVGIAGDNVTDITLTVDGKDIPVSRQNNVAYADLPLKGVQAEIKVTYNDGQVTHDALVLQGTN